MNIKKRFLSLLLVAIIAAMLMAGVSIFEPTPRPVFGAADLLFVGDFERGNLTGFYWIEGNNESNKPEVVAKADGHPVRAGQHSLKSYVHRYESKYPYRTEVNLYSDDTVPPKDTPGRRSGESALEFIIGNEYWIGFSVYVPSNFEPDNSSELVFQFHGRPDVNEHGERIEDWRNPILAWRVVGGDQWDVLLRWDSKPITPPDGTPGRYDGRTSVYEGPLDIGRWIDWVIHVEWAYQSGGLLEIWKDGTRVVSREGPNCYNDRRGPHIEMGIYKWPWKEGRPPTETDFRLYYHDELRVGGADASYEDVAPTPNLTFDLAYFPFVQKKIL